MSRLLLSFLAAFWAVCSVTSLIGPETNSVVMSNSFYSVISFCGIAFLIYHSFSWGKWRENPTEETAGPFSRRRRHKKRILAGTAGFLFSLCIVLGTDLRTNGDIIYTAENVIKKLLQATGLTFPVSALLLAAMFYLPKAGRWLARSSFATKPEGCPWLQGKRLFFLSWAVIFRCRLLLTSQPAGRSRHPVLSGP